MSSASTRHLTLKPDDQLESFVIIISKKVAKLAVHRNKLKRRLGELIRVEITTKSDLVVGGYVYTRKGAGELTFNELKSEVLELFN